jgi:hypothetical protein
MSGSWSVAPRKGSSALLGSRVESRRACNTTAVVITYLFGLFLATDYFLFCVAQSVRSCGANTCTVEPILQKTTNYAILEIAFLA